MKALNFLRSLVFSFLLFPIYTIFLSLTAFFSYVFLRQGHIANTCSVVWSRLSNFLLGVSTEEVDRNLIPPGACLFLFNHTSIVDIFVLKACNPELKFGAKIELFKIPIFGLALKASGMLPIARHRREQVMRVYDEAVARTKNGERFALAPEGSRNAKEELLPFKSGPFIFAIQAGIPVVPVVIRGAQACWPKGHLLPMLDYWKKQVRIQYLPPIATNSYTLETRHELISKTFDLMQDAISG